MSLVTDKPLRKDAERNRRLILDVALELFEQRGLGVTLNDIAHHAGVGVGTVYRRFPDKTALIESLFEQKLQELVALMQAAIADPDPWHGLTGFLEGALELQSHDLALKDLVLDTPEGMKRVCRIRSRLMPLGIELVRRAHASGQLRADIGPTDIPMIQLMVMNVIDGAREVDPQLWRRYLQIVLQGLRADPGPPAPLEIPPLQHDAVDRVMSATKLPRR
ncbi:MAG TPA: TetR/AcrR family transcriptional regulator [Solirubrobacteraceae bacterium]|nr:TetR/AcrR family transcriptional regulator [Solirubrobacteraceae bacterium]